MNTISAFIEKTHKDLLSQQYRKLLVLDGVLSWQQSTLKEIFDYYCHLNNFSWVIWGELDNFNENKVTNFRQQLGQENDLIIFYDDGFHPDAFAALAGTLKAGGLMIWLPTEGQNRDSSSLFIRRFWQKIMADDQVICINENAVNFVKPVKATIKEEDTSFPYSCITHEQVEAVEAVVKLVTGHRNRPLVLTADRGRGKTSALALAVNQLFQTNHTEKNFVICAPSLLAVEVFFKQLSQSCPHGERIENSFVHNGNIVKFLPIDQLLFKQPKLHLLLIDEAAAIPLHLLKQVLSNFHRVVFSSTQHGYEGAGRGFAIKFKKHLEEESPDYHALHVKQPIRWNEKDPLERLTFEAFLLSCHADKKFTSSVKSNEVFNREVSQQELLTDEVLLENVFSVLVNAHYQTSPSDLKMLLDNDDVKLLVSFSDREEQQIVAVVLVIEEGHATSDAIEKMQQSKVQLKNQFTPQFLARHCLYRGAFEWRYWRVLRVAVVDDFQQQGIGQQLISAIKQLAQEKGVDFISTSFAATAEVLSFWQKLKFDLIRLGVTPDKASGEHSAIMLHALSSKGEGVINELQVSFYPALLSLLTEQYQYVSVELIKRVLLHWPQNFTPEFNRFDRKAVTAFIHENAQLSTVFFSIQKWLIIYFQQYQVNGEDNASTQIHALLISAFLQRQPLEHQYQQFGLTGKKHWLRALKHALLTLTENEISGV